jgi:hypothetical protein
MITKVCDLSRLYILGPASVTLPAELKLGPRHSHSRYDDTDSLPGVVGSAAVSQLDIGALCRLSGRC